MRLGTLALAFFVFGTSALASGEADRWQSEAGRVTTTRDDWGSSGRWGSLASFGAKRYPGTKRYYGTSGNSFVALIEFGPKVRAIAFPIGGESGDPKSPHFADQSQRYASGALFLSGRPQGAHGACLSSGQLDHPHEPHPDAEAFGLRRISA